ncbi:sigma-54-dependent transcriptional regulator [Clostridium ihumii]|uniref:sigma-54-dependent transcriptional regulator n=1 Tax=Clostridium ihumii TaxID=1470356 RepID=UPI000A6A9CC4|nr:sigma-54 dependent transcriptional regulator [Clostridium ihumii]
MKILIVDDEKEYRMILKKIIEKHGYSVDVACSGEEAIKKIKNEKFNLILSDLIMDKMNGIKLLSKVKESDNDIEVILVTGYGSIQNAVEAMKKGAFSYFIKGDPPEELINEIKKVEEKFKDDTDGEFILKTNNKKFLELLELAKNAAKSNVNILILGESGVGKDVIANYIHNCSDRKERDFIPVNCCAFSDSLLESELFGHEKGAFTGALDKRIGRFESANNGTLFLDEIGDISLDVQVKLLRVLEKRTVERIGSNEEINVDFRLICATNKNLNNEIRKGNFREDFFYRISTIVLEIPPLRERKEDIEMLIKFFLNQCEKEFNKNIKKIDEKVMSFLMNYNYPGNLREMKNIIRRLVVLTQNGIITSKYLPNESSILIEDDYDEVRPLREIRREFEAEYIEKVLGKCKNNVSEAARRLEISRRQLSNKINEYNIG